MSVFGFPWLYVRLLQHSRNSHARFICISFDLTIFTLTVVPEHLVSALRFYPFALPPSDSSSSVPSPVPPLLHSSAAPLCYTHLPRPSSAPLRCTPLYCLASPSPPDPGSIFRTFIATYLRLPVLSRPIPSDWSYIFFYFYSRLYLRPPVMSRPP